MTTTDRPLLLYLLVVIIVLFVLHIRLSLRVSTLQRQLSQLVRVCDGPSYLVAR